MAVLRILDASGDTAIDFTRDDEAVLDQVRAVFDDLVHREKRLAFARRDNRGDAVLVRDFDPAAQEIVITRPLMGG